MLIAATFAAEGQSLSVHNIFGSNMVIRCRKPIEVWGWATEGWKVTVQFGEAKANATAGGNTGRREVIFPAQEANAPGRKLAVNAGGETVEMENIDIPSAALHDGRIYLVSQRATASVVDANTGKEIFGGDSPVGRPVASTPPRSSRTITCTS